MAVAVVSNIEWMWRPVECGANCTGPFKVFLPVQAGQKASFACQFIQSIDPIFGSCDTAVGTGADEDAIELQREQRSYPRALSSVLGASSCFKDEFRNLIGF